MKIKIFAFFLVFSILVGCVKKDYSEKINLDSVDAFFKITDKLSFSSILTEEEWDNLFNTQGYKTLLFQNQWRRPMLKEMILIAYSPEYSSKQDSILKIPDYANNGMLSKLILENYLDMKYIRDSLIDFKNNFNFSSVIRDSKTRLKNFLDNPIDSLLIFPSISLACFEPAGYSQANGIIMDFNMFFKQGHSENVGFLAHEMFHFYRDNFVDNEFSKINKFAFQIDKLQNEGIADLVDKKQLPYKNDAFPEQVKLFNKIANDTPKIIAELDSIVCIFYDGKITEEQFDNKMNDFFKLGGHPNGFYMACLIQDAGFYNEIISTFYNPVDFLKLYNRAAKKKGEFCFSVKFLDYLDRL
jgi:hypothetical protein